MNTVSVNPIDVSNVENELVEADKALRAAEGIVIQDQSTYELAANVRKAVNAKAKELEGERKHIKEPIIEAGKRLDSLFKRPIDMCKKVIGICDQKMINYTDIQERKRKEEQDRLDRIAEKKRQELEAKADAKRAEGQEDKADRYEEKATEVLTPVAAPRVDKPAGVHYTERWYGEVKDLKALPDEYKIADESKINKVIQATKGTLPIPGVRVFSKKIVNSRG